MIKCSLSEAEKRHLFCFISISAAFLLYVKLEVSPSELERFQLKLNVVLLNMWSCFTEKKLKKKTKKQFYRTKQTFRLFKI